MSEPTILESTPVERDGQIVYETQQPRPSPRSAHWGHRIRRALTLGLAGAVAIMIALLTLVVALPFTLLALFLGRPRGGSLHSVFGARRRP